jgi:hypothetical protein
MAGSRDNAVRRLILSRPDQARSPSGSNFVFRRSRSMRVIGAFVTLHCAILQTAGCCRTAGRLYYFQLGPWQEDQLQVPNKCGCFVSLHETWH